MCQAMVAVNMPWKCLNNKVWKNFLKKYTNQDIPNESTLRKNYLEECYNLAVEKIWKDIGNNYVWILVDETTDVTGCYIANIMVGKLCENQETQPHLLACKELPETNHATIARFVNSALKILWPSGGEEKLLLLVTDAAAYMLKAGRNLKIFYPNVFVPACDGMLGVDCIFYTMFVLCTVFRVLLQVFLFTDFCVLYFARVSLLLCRHLKESPILKVITRGRLIIIFG